MVQSQNITPGMMLSISGKLYRVESCVKVTVPRGTPFMKAKLYDVKTKKVVEKNFKPNQNIESVNLAERQLEFLYPEGKGYLFLDVSKLDQVLIPSPVLENKVPYLKEGVEVMGSFYGDTVFSVDLPQFLELMVVEADGDEDDINLSSASKMATLETGAKLEVPPFVEVGDIIKVDTKSNEYIQRV